MFYDLFWSLYVFVKCFFLFHYSEDDDHLLLCLYDVDLLLLGVGEKEIIEYVCKVFLWNLILLWFMWQLNFIFLFIFFFFFYSSWNLFCIFHIPRYSFYWILLTSYCNYFIIRNYHLRIRLIGIYATCYCIYVEVTWILPIVSIDFNLFYNLLLYFQFSIDFVYLRLIKLKCTILFHYSESFGVHYGDVRWKGSG